MSEGAKGSGPAVAARRQGNRDSSLATRPELTGSASTRLTMNRRLFLTLPFLTCLPATAHAQSDASDLERFFAGHEGSFLLRNVRTGETLRHNPEQCRRRLSPCSTFKIPNSLIGLETGVIPHADFMQRWDGTPKAFPVWMRDHTLRSAIANSVVWYYQRLAEGVGSGRMEAHLRRLRYGNQDTHGGLTQFWLDSSLRISAEEQIAFLTRLYRNDLPYSRRSQEIVKDIMFLRRTPRGTLRGKTGSGGDLRTGTFNLGWFVGWVEQAEDTWVFAANLTGGDQPSGRTARAIAEEILQARKLL